jgi:hypothetical protein
MLTINQTIEKSMCLAAVIRLEGLVPKGQESLAEGLPWDSQNERGRGGW